MLDSVIVVGVVALLIAIMRASIAGFQTEVGQMWLKLLMFAMAGALNVLNGVAFSGDAFTVAGMLGYFKDGLILGAAASGIYGMGKDLTDSTAKLGANIYTSAAGRIEVSGGVLWAGVLVSLLAPVGSVAAYAALALIMGGYTSGTVTATRQLRKRARQK